MYYFYQIYLKNDNIIFTLFYTIADNVYSWWRSL